MSSERHAALSIKQRHEKPIATVLTTQHSKSQVVPSLCIPNPEHRDDPQESNTYKGVKPTTQCRGFPKGSCYAEGPPDLLL